MLKIFLLLFGMVIQRAVLVKIEVFTKDDIHSDILCPYAILDFGRRRKVTACATMCNTVATCRGFFYNKQDGFCKGVPGFLSTTDGCEVMPGTAYYKVIDVTTTSSTTTSTTTSSATTSTTTSSTTTFTTTSSTTTSTTTSSTTTSTPTSSTTTSTTSTTTSATTELLTKFGDPCTMDADCPMTAGSCLQGTCSCLAGYRYGPSSGLCVINCITYGSTYIEYPQMGIGGANIAEYTSVTVSQCQGYCSALLVCPGFTYTAAIANGRCRLKSVTPYTDPGAVKYPPNVYYYTRNCA